MRDVNGSGQLSEGVKQGDKNGVIWPCCDSGTNTFPKRNCFPQGPSSGQRFTSMHRHEVNVAAN